MNVTGGIPTFRSFKKGLFENLQARGFRSGGDFASKQIDQDLNAQVVVAGNNYFVDITLQIATPRAAARLSQVLQQHGVNKTFNYHGAFNPIFNLSLETIVSHDIRMALSGPDWRALSAGIKDLSDDIMIAYDRLAADPMLGSATWWPESVSQDQLAMLLYTLRDRKLEPATKQAFSKYLGLIPSDQQNDTYRSIFAEAAPNQFIKGAP